MIFYSGQSIPSRRVGDDESKHPLVQPDAAIHVWQFQENTVPPLSEVDAHRSPPRQVFVRERCFTG